MPLNAGNAFSTLCVWQERDMRERVQKKRALALERARREEMVLRLHEDRLIRQEVNVYLRSRGKVHSSGVGVGIGVGGGG